MESELPGGSGIDRQQVVDGVVGHLEYMGVPGDEELRTHGLDLGDGARVVAARIAPDVGHQHPDALAFEREELGIDAAGQSAVDVAADGPERFEGGDPVGQFDRPDVCLLYTSDAADEL